MEKILRIYGLNMTADSVTEPGQKVLSMKRDFNARAGFTPQHDRLPDFLINDPILPHNITFNISDEELDTVFNRETEKALSTPK